MIVGATKGTGSSFDCTRRRVSESARHGSAAKEPARSLVPVRSIPEKCRRPIASHRANAAFLAQLSQQYLDRSDRASLRRERTAAAISAYAGSTEGPTRNGLKQDIRA